MAVIKEMKCGSGLVRIHDDYCKNNTPEDNQRIVDNVSRIVIGWYQRQNIERRPHEESRRNKKRS